MSKKESNPPPPQMSMKLPLVGCKARNKIDGFKGTVQGYNFFLNGTVQINVHPEVSESGKLRDGYYFDFQKVEVTNEDTGNFNQPEFNPQDYLGYEAEDLITGIKGIITRYSVYSNGCNDVCITSKGMTDSGKPINNWFDVLTVKTKKRKHDVPGYCYETKPKLPVLDTGGPDMKASDVGSY